MKEYINMQLKVMEPEHVLVDREADKIIAEGTNGSFCLKPRHVDFVSSLKTGILMYESGGEEYYIAVDEGILVKIGERVLVSVLNGIMGSDLSKLEQAVRQRFEKTEAMNKAAGIAQKSMEADLLLHFLELEET
ncbi:F0F1 ATP synthase subunit epsilon [Aliifodinibius salicampi]|uniref:ATP synthase epsilon chain n=1 Tax=Fodinibius salicampi TaxID=1920655 RepID=A0ABT3PUA2_9BACT|nr:F0F1 ATP synthase subunit epsilon [Fodinibius salicampi]MCW9711415.1 F0F1 ATP synthase subunit epsilon [Fodinibius salicampi]